MRVRLLSLALMLFAGSAVFAHSDARVVLAIEPSETLTPTFRRALRDMISGELRSTMEGVAAYSVVDLAEVRSEDRLPNWVAAFAKPLSMLAVSNDPVLTHYVRISLVEGQYLVESRWSNGSVGWLSPEVQRDRTPDREVLPRLVLAQIARDSGIVGLVAASDSDKAATLRFAGASTSSSAARLIRIGDLFAVMQTNRDGRFARVPNVLLRVVGEPNLGQLECRIESRYEKPLLGWEGGIYRAVKLPAIQGRVRLTVSASDPKATEGLSVRVATTGFGRPEPLVESGKLRRGEFTSTNFYDRIAFVRLLAGDRVVASHVPVEVLRDASVAIEIRPESTLDNSKATDVDLRLIRSRIQETYMQLTEENAQVSLLIEKGKNREALERVNQVLPRLEERVPQLTLELSAIGKRPDLAVGVAEADRAQRDVVGLLNSLRSVKHNLEKAIAAADSPESVKRRAALELQVAQAERAVDDADYGKAILAYEDVLREQHDWPEAKRRLDELKRGWKIASDEHRQARAAIYDTFANAATADEIAKNIEVARAAFAVCKAVGDRYTPRKLYLTLQRAAGILAQRSEQLRLAEGDNGKNQREALRQTSMQASELLTEVENYLRAQ